MTSRARAKLFAASRTSRSFDCSSVTMHRAGFIPARCFFWPDDPDGCYRSIRNDLHAGIHKNHLLPIVRKKIPLSLLTLPVVIIILVLSSISELRRTYSTSSRLASKIQKYSGRFEPHCSRLVRLRKRRKPMMVTDNII